MSVSAPRCDPWAASPTHLQNRHAHRVPVGGVERHVRHQPQLPVARLCPPSLSSANHSLASPAPIPVEQVRMRARLDHDQITHVQLPTLLQMRPGRRQRILQHHHLQVWMRNAAHHREIGGLPPAARSRSWSLHRTPGPVPAPADRPMATDASTRVANSDLLTGTRCKTGKSWLLCSLMLGVTNKQLYYAIVQWVEENQ